MSDMEIYYVDSTHMLEVGDGSVALVVTSPCYPMIAKWDELFGVVDFELQHRKLDLVWEECYRKLMDGGIMCINIGDATRTIDKSFACYPNYARVVYACMRVGFTPLVPIIWKKISNRPNAFMGSGMLPPNGYISQDHEYIAIFRKGLPRKFAPKDELRYKSAYTKEERDLWFQQTWTVPGAKGAGNSSTFPDEIPSRLIQMFSIIGDLILDCFCGQNATTGKAAIALGRRFVGYEINEGVG